MRPAATAGGAAARASGTRAAVTFGLTMTATLVALTAAVAAIAGRDWLGHRATWGIGLVAASMVALWRPRRGEGGAALATVLLVVGGIVVATDLSGASDHDFAERALGDDIPPVAAYVAAMGFGASAVACASVTWLRPRAGSVGSRRPSAKVAGTGALVAAALVAAVVPAGTALRSAADRRAEARDLAIGLTTVAERRDEAPGPARPWHEAWSADLPPHPGRSVAVPGWDVVLVVSLGAPFWLAAVSKASGEELWTYRRQGHGGVRVTVDPEAGRALLTEGDAAVSLSLENGSEQVTRRLPYPVGCLSFRGHYLDVAPRALLRCRDDDRRAVLVDVASGRPVASTDPPEDRGPEGGGPPSSYCERAIGAGPAPVVVRAGHAACARPEVVAYDPGSGDFGAPVTLEPPVAWSDLPGPLPAFTSEIRADPVVTGDLVVLSLLWLIDDDDADAATVPRDDRAVYEVVALDRDGEVLWRHPRFLAAHAITDRGVLAHGEDEWQLLSPADGTVVARSAYVAGEEEGLRGQVATTDGERLYSAGQGGALVVRDLADLTVREVREDLVPEGRPARLHAGDGRLIVQHRDGGLTAYGEAPAP